MFNNEDDEDLFWVVIIIAGVVAFGGAWFAALLAPVRQWSLQAGLVTTHATIVDLPGGVGLDLPRLLVLGGVIALALALGGFWMVARVRSSQQKKRLRDGEAS